MTMTIGRVGTDGLLLNSPDPDGITQDGDELTIRGKLTKAGETLTLTSAQARIQRAQILGLAANPDEMVVPFTDTENPHLDGFYVVIDSGVTDPEHSSVVHYPYTVKLARIPDWQVPTMEVRRSGPAYRDNDNSISTAKHIVALPGGFLTPRFSVAQDDEESVPTSDGSVRVYADAAPGLNVTYAIGPASFYEGTCRIETSDDEGASWQTVVGRQIDNLPTWVRIGNGRVRCTLSLALGATVLTTEVWDPDPAGDGSLPADWEATDFHVVDTGGTSSITTYTNAQISYPSGICAITSNSRVYWASPGNNRIGRASMAGNIGSSPVGVTTDDIHSVCEGPDGNIWFTYIRPTSAGVGKMTTAGVVTLYPSADVGVPLGICAGPDGLVWFVDQANNRVFKVTTTGTFTYYTDANISNPWGICAGPDGLLWVTSTGNDRIAKITTTGTVTTYSTGVGNAPYNICAGPDGLLWYTRSLNNAICKITTAGSVTTYTSGVPVNPGGICTDGTDLYVTHETGVAKVTTSGVVTTYTDANVDNSIVGQANGICEGADGNLWFISQSNNRIGSINPVTGVFETLEFGGKLTVNKNSPETASIRVGAAEGDELLDLTIRRGSNIFEGLLNSETAAAYGIYRTASETGANLTGGIKANAANADGNIFTLLSPQVVTRDITGTSGIYLTSGAATFHFGFSPTHADTVAGTATIINTYYSTARRQLKIVKS